MRDPLPNAALPRAPDTRQQEGLRVARGGVRCTTPGCNRKLAEALRGTLTIVCDRCKREVTITSP